MISIFYLSNTAFYRGSVVTKGVKLPRFFQHRYVTYE
jgi:hypothetical protein